MERAQEVYNAEMAEVVIKNHEELSHFAEQVLSVLPRKGERATVLALHGNLGAGKTAFTQALGTILKVSEHITSPTFVLMKRYMTHAHDFFTTLVHIDAYRLEESSEAGALNLTESMNNPHNLIVIEWAERIADTLPQDTFHISFEHTDEDTRTVSYGVDR